MDGKNMVLIPRCQHFRDVIRLNGGGTFLEQSLDLHEAAGIGAYDALRAGGFDRRDFHFIHCHGNVGKFHGESSAESTAGFAFAHFDKLKAAYGAKEFSGFLFQMKFSQSMTSIVPCNTFVECCAHIANAELFDEEFGEFKRLLGNFLMFVGKRVFKEFTVKFLHHGGARAGWGDDDFSVVKDVDKSGRDFFGVLPMAGIKSRLAAAGLLRGKIDFVSEALQHFHNADAYSREKLVDKAGDEKGDFHTDNQPQKRGRITKLIL
jgi:hypothetical protein